jgi:hypothetical protein
VRPKRTTKQCAGLDPRRQPLASTSPCDDGVVIDIPAMPLVVLDLQAILDRLAADGYHLVGGVGQY